MDVGGEARLAQRLRPQVVDRRDVEGFEDRVDADAVAVGHLVVETDRDAVHQDQVDLGVRHAETLNQVLDRCAGGADVLELPAPPLGRQQITKLGVETDADRGQPDLLRRRKQKGSPGSASPATEAPPLLRSYPFCISSAQVRMTSKRSSMSTGLHARDGDADIGGVVGDDAHAVVVQQLHAELLGVDALHLHAEEVARVERVHGPDLGEPRLGEHLAGHRRPLGEDGVLLGLLRLVLGIGHGLQHQTTATGWASC